MKKMIGALTAKFAVALMAFGLAASAWGGSGSSLPSADANGVITLTEDFTLTSTGLNGQYKLPNNITLDLGGNTLTLNNSFLHAGHANNQTVTISNGTIAVTGTNSSVLNLGGDNVGGTKATISNVNIDISSELSRAAITIRWTSEGENSMPSVVLKDITITGTGLSQKGIYVLDSEGVEIDNCTINLTGSSSSALKCNYQTGANSHHSSITVKNSTFSSNSDCVSFTDGVLNIYNTTLTTTGSSSKGSISAKLTSLPSGSISNSINIYSGTVLNGKLVNAKKGETDITFGEGAKLNAAAYNSIVDWGTQYGTAACAEGYGFDGPDGDGYYTVVSVAPPVARITTMSFVKFEGSLSEPHDDLYVNLNSFAQDGELVDSEENVVIFPAYGSITDNITLYTNTADEWTLSPKALYDDAVAHGQNPALYEGVIVTKSSHETFEAAIAAVEEGETIVVVNYNAEMTAPEGWQFVTENDVTTLVPATAVAKIGETEYETLAAALADVTKNAPLTWVSDDAWPSATPVYYNGNFYATLNAAVNAANTANDSNAALIYCKPTVDVSGTIHNQIKTSITVFGNNAHLNCYNGTQYQWDVYFGSTTKNLEIRVYNLHDGLYLWGSHTSNHNVTVEFANCENMYEYYLSRSTGTGTMNVTFSNCTFDFTRNANNLALWFLIPGTYVVDGCTFVNFDTANKIPVQLETSGSTSFLVKDCSFTDCVPDDGCALVRAISDSGTVNFTVDGVSFADDNAAADIDVGYPDASMVGTVNFSITPETNASLRVFFAGSKKVKYTTSIAAGETHTGDNLYAAEIEREDFVKISANITEASADVYLDMWGFWGMKGMVDAQGNECPHYVPITDNTMYRDLYYVDESAAEAWVSAKYIYDNYFAPGKSYNSQQTTRLYEIGTVFEKFATLEAAVADAKDGETIILVVNSNADVVLPAGGTLVTTGVTYGGTVTTVAGYRVTENDGVYTSVLGIVTFTVAVPANTTVTVTGATPTGNANEYTCESDTQVTITYTAVGDYVVKGGTQQITVTSATESPIAAPSNMTVNPAVAQIVGGDKYETLAAAIAAAVDGDTIELLSNVTWDGTGSYYWLKAAGSVTIDGKGYTLSAPAAGGPTDSAIMLGDSSNGTTLNVYTITNMTFSGFSGNDHSVIRCQAVTANIVDCTFVDNTIAGSKWGIVTGERGVSLNVKNCVFRDNDIATKCIDFGFNNTNGNPEGTMVVDGCVFENNTISDSGVVYVAPNTVSAVIQNSTFSGNEINASGAAVVYCSNPATIAGNLFTNNTVKVTGSGNKCGVLALGSGATNSVFTVNAFVDNTTTYEGGAKATVYVGATNVDLDGNYWGDGTAPEIDDGSDIYIASGKSATYDTYATAYAVNDNGRGVTVTLYVPPVAQIVRIVDDVAVTNEYTSLAAAIADVPTDGTATTISMIANEAIDIAGNALEIAVGKNVVLDLNGHQVVGFCGTGENSAMILNNGTLTIVDSTDTNSDGTGDGILKYSASPTWNWSGVDGDYSGSFASNLISNNGTVDVVSGCLEVNNPANKICSAAFVIDNASGGIVNIEGGKLGSNCSDVIRMRVSNSAESALTISGGSVVALPPSNRAIWLQASGSNAKSTVNISGGLVSGSMYSVQDGSSGSYAKDTITGGTFSGFIYTTAELDISGGEFNGAIGNGILRSIMAYGSKARISGGVFSGRAEFYSTASSIDWSVTGGAFSQGRPYQYAGYNSEEFVRGGIYDDEPLYLAQGYLVVKNTDTETKVAYPHAVVPAVASITADDKTVYYATFEDAIDDAELDDSVVITVIGYDAATMVAPDGWKFVTENDVTTLVRAHYVAQIVTNEGASTNKYESLRAAIEAVPTTGTATTITMIDDSAEAAVITIPATKNVVLDLNGKTVSATAAGSEWHLIVNRGVLTVQDSVGGGAITADGTVTGELSVIYNIGGTLNLVSGTISYTGNWYIGYAVCNSSNAWGVNDDKVAVFNMTGGTISAPNGDAALRVYQNCAAVLDPVSTNHVNITGGTVDNNGIFVDTYLYQSGSTLPEGVYDGSNIDVSINISGNVVFRGLIDLKIRHTYNTKLNIAGGTFENFKLGIRRYEPEWSSAIQYPAYPLVDISGGAFTFKTGSDARIFSSWKLFANYTTEDWADYRDAFKVTGGVFNVDLNDYDTIVFEEGKTGVANTDPETATAYPYTVGTNVPVAAVIAADGVTTNGVYYTLQDAFDNVASGETIELLADIVLSGTASLEANGTYVIDGNGYTISQATVADFGSDGALSLGESTSQGSEANIQGRNYTLINVTFTGFSSEIVRAEDCTIAIEGCTFTNNTITCDAGRGDHLLRFAWAAFAVEGCTFSENTADQLIYIDEQKNTATTINVSGNLFTGNTITGHGIIQVADPAKSTNDAIVGNTFRDNTLNTDVATAVLYISAIVENISNNLFLNNTISTSGSNKEAVIVVGSAATGTVINENAFVGNILGTTANHYATIYVGADCDLSDNYWGVGADAEIQDTKDVYKTGNPTIISTSYAVAYAVNANGRGVTVTIPAFYTATFEAGEAVPEDVTGLELPASIKFWNSGLEVTLPYPTYTASGTTRFAGWLIGGEGNTIRALPEGTTGDVTLVATWTVAEPITVEGAKVSEEPAPTAAINLPKEWLDAAPEEGSDKTNKELLNVVEDNGFKKWENYVLGLDGSDPNAKVGAVAEQGLTTMMPVESTVKVTTVDTGFTVTYQLNEVDNAGTTVGEGTPQDSPDLSVNLSDVEDVSYYKVVATIKSPEGETMTTATSENIIGVLKVESSVTTTAVAVPWASYDGTNDISVADIVRTANLTEGDSLKAYDPDSKTYKEWTLGADKTWQPSSTYSTSGTTSGNESAGNADAYKVARGSAVWLTRTDPSQPIYLVGGAASGTVETKLEAAPSDTKSSWNLVGNPKVESVDVKNLLGAKTGDQVIVPTAGAPKNYVYVEGKGWGYYKTVPYEIDGVKVGVVSVFTTVDTDVPAGTGFWYLNSSTSKDAKINW